MRRLLIIPAALLVLLGGPVLATESTTPPPVTTDEVPVAPTAQSVSEGWQSAVTPVDANVVGVSWEGDRSTEFTIEVQHADGTWAPAKEVHGDSDRQVETGTEDAVGATADAATSTDPIWIGDEATAVRVTVAEGTATNVTVEAVDAASADPPSGSAGAAGFLPIIDGPDRYLFAAGLLGAAALLVAIAFGWSPWRRHSARRAVLVVCAGALLVTACRPAPPYNGTVQPPIIMRSQWGARAFGTGPITCSAPAMAPGGLRFAVVHHTAGSNNYTPAQSAAIVRGIQSYHMNANGYCDAAYHFLIDKYGQIFEGRAGGITNPVIGGHAGGFNTGSVGVALLGDYTSVKPSNAQWQALGHLLRWRLSVGYVNPLNGFWQTVASSPCNCQNWPPGSKVYMPNAIVTHRDVDRTGCPGNAFYPELATLRKQVQSGIVFPPTTASTSSTTSTLGSGAATEPDPTTTSSGPTTTSSSSP
jgi:hypothetical protein